MRFIPWILRPVILLMLASVALVENSKAQSLCDTLFIPRGNIYPPERRELCQADTIILQGIRPENGYEMRWFRNGSELAGEAQEILEVTEAGNYSFRLFREGCLSQTFDAVTISFRNQSRPKARQLSLQQAPGSPGSQFTLQLQSLGNVATVSRSWFRNGILENNSGLTLTGRNTGRYRVRTDSAGCSSFSNELLVRPAGSFVPQICLSEPVEPNGLRVEWIPPSDTAVKQFKVYRKKYYESVFSFVDTVSPSAGSWINDTILYRTAYDVMITAKVSGAGGDYESEPSPVNQTIFLSVQPAPAGSSGGNVLNWNSYEGFPVSSYYILRNEQVVDSVSGTQNSWHDANPTANPQYRIEAPATENCTSVMSDIDGNVYQTVQIGSQVWMKENLRVSKYRNGDPIPTGLDSASWVNAESGAYAIYDNLPNNNTLYGKLYNWYAVVDPHGLCPGGWHSPTDGEWKTLETFLGMPAADLNLAGFNNLRGQAQNVGGKMKAVSSLWPTSNTGATDASGFKGLPGGNRIKNGPFSNLGNGGFWWSSTQTSSSFAWTRCLLSFDGNSYRDYLDFGKNYGMSVRCVKDAAETGSIDSLDCAGKVQMNYLAENSPVEKVKLIIPYFGGNGGSYNSLNVSSSGLIGLSANILNGNFATGSDSLVFSINGTPAGFGTATFNISIGGKQCNISINVADTGSVRDIDGNLYTSIKIGTQVWMQQNLRVSKYRNGDTITTNLTDEQWAIDTAGAFAVYLDNDTNDLTYGKLYNWHAVADQRNLCPAGWKVPSAAEWAVLENYLGGDSVAGGKLKSTGTKQSGTGLWFSPNKGATNLSGFTALPGGRRNFDGTYFNINDDADCGFWTSSEEPGGGLARMLDRSYVNSATLITDKTKGLSVRCLKDSSNGLGIETSLIPAGTFTMGSPSTEPDRGSDEVQHQVTLSAYRMSKYEITNSQYAGFLNAKGIGSNGIYAAGAYPTQTLIDSNAVSGLIWTGAQWQPVSGKDNFPVVFVTWFGAAEFATFAGGRLPTEAEWEYACRGGTNTAFSTGACLNNTQANYRWDFPLTGCSNTSTAYPNQTQAVNSYSPNAYGLYNMHGNVWEWCADWYDAYPTTAQTNPTGPANGAIRVIRGGSWGNIARICRSAFRNGYGPDYYSSNYGFRLAFAP